MAAQFEFTAAKVYNQSCSFPDGAMFAKAVLFILAVAAPRHVVGAAAISQARKIVIFVAMRH